MAKQYLRREKNDNQFEMLRADGAKVAGSLVVAPLFQLDESQVGSPNVAMLKWVRAMISCWCHASCAGVGVGMGVSSEAGLDTVRTLMAWVKPSNATSRPHSHHMCHNKQWACSAS